MAESFKMDVISHLKAKGMLNRMQKIKNLLELRKMMKSKKPTFSRQDSHKKKKLGSKWRRPKGLQSKMRIKFKGYRRSVSTGYMGPKSTRNLHKSGLSIIYVNTLNDIKNLRKEINVVVISRKIGQKKKFEILKKVKEIGIKVLNIKNIDLYIKKVEKIMAEKKEKIENKKKAAKKEDIKPKKDKKLDEKLHTEEEKKDEEKKEKDKLLTKRI